MKTLDTKRRFIELRAKGWSFQRISTEIGVTKPVLIGWARELSDEIRNLRAQELEALQEEFQLFKEGRIRMLGNIVRKIIEGLDRSDFSKTPPDKLVDMIIRFYPLLKAEFEEPKVLTEEEIEEHKTLARTLSLSMQNILGDFSKT